ncbi:hypothetical protein DY000_02021675 [Brassica cretica]|uniref:Uncharacterized protein n=1 Tax=Brassica cretica TaxID=69181 RepID=A0ABQ7EHL0_BRACR|nr:hypothetical protein DY000_02021675 [Brassica cretica]
MFVATEDIGQQRKTKDKDAEHGEDLNHSEDEEEKKDEEERNDEEYQKDKEKRKDKDHSMSNSEKLDKLIQMVCDLDKRVVVIQNVLGVKEIGQLVPDLKEVKECDLVDATERMQSSGYDAMDATEWMQPQDIGQQRKTKDKDAEHGEDLNHSEDEEEKKDEEERNDEEYQKDKEKRKDKDHSMSNSEKLDKLIQMVCDLDKRVVVIQNVLGVKVSN